MSSQTNIPISARSMNGIITLSDGAGTLIQNGVITTGNLYATNLVTIDGTQTISGAKTFTNQLVVNNANTDITATGTSSDGLIRLTATDPLATGLYGQIQLLGANRVTMQSNTSSFYVSPSLAFTNIYGQYEIALSGVDKTYMTGVLTTNTNDTITNVTSTAFKVQTTSGTDKLNIAPTLTTNTNTTITDVASTAFKVQNVSGTDKLSIAPTLTTNTNTTITDVATTRNFQVVAGTDIVSIAAGGISSKQSMSISKQLSTDSGGFLIITNGYLNGTQPFLYIKKSFSLLGSWGTRLYNGVLSDDTISVGGVETETNILTWDSATFACLPATQTFLAGTTFKVQSVSGIDKINVLPASTTITDTDIYLVGTNNLHMNATAGYLTSSIGTSCAFTAGTTLVLTSGTTMNLNAITSITQQVNSVTKETITSALTTLTNTSIDIVAPLYSQSYAVGTTSSSIPLCSCVLDYHSGMGIVASTFFTMNTNMWGATYTTNPNWAVPFKVLVYGFSLNLDNAPAIVGTATTGSVTLRVWNSSLATNCGQNITAATFTLNTANAQSIRGVFSTPIAISAGSAIQLQFSLYNSTLYRF